VRAGVRVPTVPLLNAARTCFPTGDRAPDDLPDPSCSGHVPLAAETCRFRVAAYRGVQSSCHKKDEGKDRTVEARLSLYNGARSRRERPLNFN